jgi:hypothetical protein
MCAKNTEEANHVFFVIVIGVFEGVLIFVWFDRLFIIERGGGEFKIENAGNTLGYNFACCKGRVET